MLLVSRRLIEDAFRREAGGRKPIWMQNISRAARFFLAVCVGALCVPSTKVVQASLDLCAASPTVSAAPMAKHLVGAIAAQRERNWPAVERQRSQTATEAEVDMIEHELLALEVVETGKLEAKKPLVEGKTGAGAADKSKEETSVKDKTDAGAPTGVPVSDLLTLVTAPSAEIVQGILKACAASPTVSAAPMAKNLVGAIAAQRERNWPAVAVVEGKTGAGAADKSKDETSVKGKTDAAAPAVKAEAEPAKELKLKEAKAEESPVEKPDGAEADVAASPTAVALKVEAEPVKEGKAKVTAVVTSDNEHAPEPAKRWKPPVGYVPKRVFSDSD